MMTSPTSTSRRQFLKTSALAGGALVAPAILRGQSASGNDQTLKVGLVGCGGRGTGAASQTLHADNNVVLTALADVYPDKIQATLEILRKDIPDKVKVEEDHCFTGLDAFQKLIDSGVDVVLLATPPGFRPQHLRAAVAANKHIFCEKPVATDGPGVRSVFETVAMAKEKKLALVSGFCWRYNYAEQGLFERLLDGHIGVIEAIYATYYTGVVRPMPAASQRPGGSTDLDWQLRNWYNFNWLSGDGYVEQAVHAVDWMCWAMHDVPPAKAVAVGGRQIPSEGGNIYDHFAVNYEYANGTKGFLASRQQAGCSNDNSAYFMGTDGNARELGFAGMPFIRSSKPWKYAGPRPNMYDVEHQEMYKSIRAGNPINNGERMTRTTLTAIMGRMAAYTGKEITWDMALNSQERLVPPNITWDMTLPVVPVARPGESQYV
ncbi:MAG TPA: Gfo/Idh/MocA family oxidoreductase [Verrucomicrobiae bacterium]|jgi:predicted dehydrogenase|nr:Gfo/Idh/MocA family oxidoreductase [Verrucomicrobiae bacterium]